MIFLFLALLCPVYSLKAVHLGDGRVYKQDEVNQPPSKVERIWMRVTKATTDGSSDEVVVHILRLQWTLPRFWADSDESNRNFGVVCEAEDVRNNETFSVLDVSVSSDITAIHEQFVLPPASLSLICAVRPQNSKGLFGEWKFSKVFLLDGPTVEGRTTQSEETTKTPTTTQRTAGSIRKKEEKEAQLSKEDIRELLKSATLIEVPFPQMEPRKTIRIKPHIEMESTEVTETSEALSTTTMKPTTYTTTTTTSLTTGVTEAPEGQASDNSQLFLRGLTLNPSDLPAEEEQQMPLPFSSNAFGSDDAQRLDPPGRLAPEIETDYDILEQRIREAIGTAHERVLK